MTKDDELVHAAQVAVERLNEALRQGGRRGRYMEIDPVLYLELRNHGRAKAQEQERRWLLAFPPGSTTLACFAEDERPRGSFLFEVFEPSGTSVFPAWRAVGMVLDDTVPFEGPRHRRVNPSRPNLDETLSVVSEKVAHAIFVAAKALSALGERYALIGGAAVGAYGAPRSTKDVDFLVGGERVFRTCGEFISYAEGVPIEVGGVPVRYQTADGHVARALDFIEMSRGVPLLPVEVLVALKLRTNRRQDRIDVGALVFEAGVDVGVLTGYVEDNEAELLPRLERALQEWEEEHT